MLKQLTTDMKVVFDVIISVTVSYSFHVDWQSDPQLEERTRDLCEQRGLRECH